MPGLWSNPARSSRTGPKLVGSGSTLAQMGTTRSTSFEVGPHVPKFGTQSAHISDTLARNQSSMSWVGAPLLAPARARAGRRMLKLLLGFRVNRDEQMFYEGQGPCARARGIEDKT